MVSEVAGSSAEGEAGSEADAEAEGVALGVGLAEGFAVGLADAVDVSAAAAGGGVRAGRNPSCGSRRKATRPTASAAIPTERMGHNFGRDGAEAARCTPCREETSGTLSNSSRAKLVMVKRRPCWFSPAIRH
jgi:hypothetical protein